MSRIRQRFHFRNFGNFHEKNLKVLSVNLSEYEYVGLLFISCLENLLQLHLVVVFQN